MFDSIFKKEKGKNKTKKHTNLHTLAKSIICESSWSCFRRSNGNVIWVRTEYLILEIDVSSKHKDPGYLEMQNHFMAKWDIREENILKINIKFK